MRTSTVEAGLRRRAHRMRRKTPAIKATQGALWMPRSFAIMNGRFEARGALPCIELGGWDCWTNQPIERVEAVRFRSVRGEEFDMPNQPAFRPTRFRERIVIASCHFDLRTADSRSAAVSVGASL